MKELPEGWVDVRLGDFAKTEKGKKPKVLSSERTEACPIPYVNIKAFEKNVIDEYTDGKGCVICEDDDFLMVWDGSRSGYVGKAIKGALGSTLVRIKFPNVNHDYAYFFLQSKFVEINTRAKGVGIPHVDPNLVWNYRFPLPPLPVQQAIVTKIEEIFSELDHGVEQLKTAQQQLKVYRQAVLKWAFEGRLTNAEVKDGELPEGWKWVRLGAVAEMCLGKMLDKQKNTGVLKPYLGNINVRWGRFNLEDLQKMRFEDKENERYNLKRGDLVICEGGEPGRAAIWKDQVPDMKIQKALHRVRFCENTVTEYFFYYLKLIAHAKKLDQYFTGTTIKHLTGQSLKKIEFPLPPLSEQHQIVAEIERRLSVCDKLEETLVESLKAAEVLRAGVLKKAFEGKIV